MSEPSSNQAVRLDAEAAEQERSIPQKIVDDIKEGHCILFLGAMVSAPSPASLDGTPYQYKHAPPSGGELSERLAARLEKEKDPYPGRDSDNLQRVSLYYEYRTRGSRGALIDAIKEEISGYSDEGSGGKSAYRPSPALEMLAEMPFPIIVTTNYDRLFDTALSRADARSQAAKQPLRRIYDPDPRSEPESVPLDPDEEKPILLKLHGDIETPKSIVVTEEDYLVFIQKMGDSPVHPVHQSIRARMTTWPMLFIGYSLKDYNFRLLFRTLRWHQDPAELKTAFSVDPKPDNVIVLVHQWSKKQKVNFIKKDLWEVVPSLYRRVMGRDYGPRP